MAEPSLTQMMPILCLFFSEKKKARLKMTFMNGTCGLCGPGSSSGKVLGYGLDGPGSNPGVGGVEIFLRYFVSRLVLRCTQPPIK